MICRYCNDNGCKSCGKHPNWCGKVLAPSTFDFLKRIRIRNEGKSLSEIVAMDPLPPIEQADRLAPTADDVVAGYDRGWCSEQCRTGR